MGPLVVGANTHGITRDPAIAAALRCAKSPTWGRHCAKSPAKIAVSLSFSMSPNGASGASQSAEKCFWFCRLDYPWSTCCTLAGWSAASRVDESLATDPMDSWYMTSMEGSSSTYRNLAEKSEAGVCWDLRASQSTVGPRCWSTIVSESSPLRIPLRIPRDGCPGCIEGRFGGCDPALDSPLFSAGAIQR